MDFGITVFIKTQTTPSLSKTTTFELESSQKPSLSVESDLAHVIEGTRPIIYGL